MILLVTDGRGDRLSSRGINQYSLILFVEFVSK